jgi:hypothetical protein
MNSEGGYEWPTFEDTDDENLMKAYDLLTFSGNAASMEAKAQRQILGLLLTTNKYQENTDNWLENIITAILKEYNSGTMN